MENLKQFYHNHKNDYNINTPNQINENYNKNDIERTLYCKTTSSIPTTTATQTATATSIVRKMYEKNGNNSLDDADDDNNDNQNDYLIKSSNSTNSLRLNVQKSHTCGSLFAKCSCDIISAAATATAATTATTAPLPDINDDNDYDDYDDYDDDNNFHFNTTKIQQYNDKNSTTQTPTNNNGNRNNNIVVYGNNFLDTAESSTQMLSNQQFSKVSRTDKLTRSSKVSTSTNSNSNSNSNIKKSKKLFQSYSHPDTNFIFTDDNRKPSKLKDSLTSSLRTTSPSSSSTSSSTTTATTIPTSTNLINNFKPSHKHKNSNEVIVRHTKSTINNLNNWKNGTEIINYEFNKNIKRSSSPNIGNYTILDVHPEILLKILNDDENNDNSNSKNLIKQQFNSTSLKIMQNTNNLLDQSKSRQNAKYKKNSLNEIASGSKIYNSTNSMMTNMKINQNSNNINVDDNINDDFIENNDNNNDNDDYDDDDILFSSCNCDGEKRARSLIDEVVTLKDIVKNRDKEILKLKREIHKLKSVLQQTAHQMPFADCNLLTSLQTHPNLMSQKLLIKSNATNNNNNFLGIQSPLSSSSSSSTSTSPSQSLSFTNSTCNNQPVLPPNIISNSQIIKPATAAATTTSSGVVNNSNDLLPSSSKQIQNHQQQQQPPQPQAVKKQGVSGESSDSAIQQSQNVPIPKYEKDFRSKQLIKDAIMDNDFLKNIDSSQVRELVESMYNLEVGKSEYVIREGEVGAHLYVSAEGEFEVIKNDIVLGIMGPGKAFGELAILYNCTRTASIRIISNGAKVWVLDRRIFQQIMMRSGMQRIEDNVRFLKSVPLLRNLSNDVLAKISDVLEVEFYPAGTYIIRQGHNGDSFFLISQGNVKVTQKIGNSSNEKEIRTLQRGDYFGEQALINEDKRTANIIALPPGVECLTLDRESFSHLIGDLCELKQKNYGDESRVLAMKYDEKSTEIFGRNVKQEFPELTLNDLEVVATLGIGGFGRVELVKCYRNDENRVETYALKCLKKKHIIDTRQEEHVFSERTIMLTCKTPFICRLYRTFRDSKYLYMMLEACMGGEVWTILRDRGTFDENMTQFIIGCVLEAFEYLHSRGIIYRDLKPENLMLDQRGYVKLVDFGFAKQIGVSQKTWTFCGTPEYVAPEIILNKGHDRAVDYWALGILMHELLNGTPPFTSNDPMKTYNIILKGIDMIDFPKQMSRSAIMLIKKLCRDVPAERLGYQKGGIQDIKKHKWFQGFDWDGLSNLTLIPPFLRPVSHPFDTSYFDKFPVDTDIPPDEISGWDSDF